MGWQVRSKMNESHHHGTDNVFNGAMESYIDAWAPIHAEYSYKALRGDIDALARFTNFEIIEDFLDPKGWFCDSLCRAIQMSPAYLPLRSSWSQPATPRTSRRLVGP